MRAKKFLPFCVVLVACTEQPSVSDVARNLVPNGYFCTTTPSEAYSPGYVYRIDPNGAELLVDELSAQAETFAFRAALGTYDATVSRGAGLKISLLEPLGAVSGQAEAGASSSLASKVSFSDGRFLLMSDSGIAAITEMATRTLKPEPQSRYFVVRDSIQAQGIDIKLTSQSELTLGGEAAIAELLSTSPNVNLSREQTLTINGMFESPLNVCIRAVQMEPVARSDSDNEGQTVSEGQSWRITNVSASSAEAARILEQ